MFVGRLSQTTMYCLIQRTQITHMETLGSLQDSTRLDMPSTSIGLSRIAHMFTVSCRFCCPFFDDAARYVCRAFLRLVIYVKRKCPASPKGVKSSTWDGCVLCTLDTLDSHSRGREQEPQELGLVDAAGQVGNITIRISTTIAITIAITITIAIAF